MTNQEMMKKESSAVSTHVADQGGEQILRSDVLIPKVLLMQGLSDLVAERKAMQGDMVKSTTAEKLGDDRTPVEFIPLTFQNQWMVQEKIGQKFEYRKMLPRVALIGAAAAQDAARSEEERMDENLPWNFTMNGTEWRRVKVFNVFALLAKDVAAFIEEEKKAKETGEMFDLDKTLMPVVISFRSTSYNAGKVVATHFTKARTMAHLGAKAHGYTMFLKCNQDKNDLGTYFVFDVSSGRKATKEEFHAADGWAKILSTQQVQVDESDDRTAERDVTAETNQF